ncbi:HD domain-containing protein [Paenibacillus sp. GYB004]|uniref:HD-GYP domain-containing protein n=1 Tax=Paenibacillus sp. GYB004 TaxID=2994393 RepID=UPI002F96A01F
MLYAINRLLQRLSDKDRETFEHVGRVGALAQCWVTHYPLAGPEDRQVFIVGCCVHDVGKIKIETAILQKTCKLDQGEWDRMRTHPESGSELLMQEGMKDARLLDIVKYHHERWDGSGYPTGLGSSRIPRLARMCSIVDAFDAMTSDRPYKKGKTVEQAKEELLEQSGIQFDEELVLQFLSLPDHLLRNPPAVRLDEVAEQGDLFYELISSRKN